MDIFSVFIVVMILILGILVSINKKLSLLVAHHLTPTSDENDINSEIRDELVEIRQTLEQIRYTTDIIENYNLPTPSERKSIDQMRVDQEIDEMLFKRKHSNNPD